MAEFCKQCADERGEPSDLAGVTTPEDWAMGKGVLAICEGCGPVIVGPAGECAGICLNKAHVPPPDVMHFHVSETGQALCGADHRGLALSASWRHVTCPACKKVYVDDMEKRGVIPQLIAAGLLPPEES
jgi:hypothetical protein